MGELIGPLFFTGYLLAGVLVGILTYIKEPKVFPFLYPDRVGNIHISFLSGVVWFISVWWLFKSNSEYYHPTKSGDEMLHDEMYAKGLVKWTYEECEERIKQWS